jgi:hypothetical protein
MKSVLQKGLEMLNGRKTKSRGTLLVCIAWLACSRLALSQHEFQLKNGDKVVFYGDSITEQQHYTQIVETYVVTRYPNLNLTFVNSGWGGDTVKGGRGDQLIRVCSATLFLIDQRC